MDPIDALLAFAALPAPALEPDDGDAFAHPVFGQALMALRRMAPAERDASVRTLAGAVSRVPDGYQAARLAVVCGTAVEWGTDPGIPGPAVVDRLRVEAATADGGLGSARAVRLVSIAAMAVLARDVAVRRWARALPGLDDALAPHADAEVDFVRTVLGLVDDLEIVLLHAERSEGAWIRTEAVANGFHLTTLVQDAFPEWCPGDDPVDPSVVAQARGDAEPAPLDDHARLQLSYGAGLPASGAPLAEAALWGEATPTVIPEVAGERVLLVGPVTEPKAWDSGFFPNIHPALHPRVEVLARLDADEVSSRMRRLRGR